RLLSAPAALVSEPAERARDWGEAPSTIDFVGRSVELDLLRHWVLVEQCRLVALLGMGGIGKTTVAARLAQTVAPSFDQVYWRSLRTAPPVDHWLAGAIAFLSGQQLVPPHPNRKRSARCCNCCVSVGACWFSTMPRRCSSPGSKMVAIARGWTAMAA